MTKFVSRPRQYTYKGRNAKRVYHTRPPNPFKRGSTKWKAWNKDNL